jgi:L-lactate dehydrogenase (cytochrome)
MSPVLREEIETGMRLLGVTSLDQLTPELIRYVDRGTAGQEWVSSQNL